MDGRMSAAQTMHLRMIGVAFFWGGTWVAARIAVADLPPLTVAAWRFLLAVLVLGGVLMLRGGLPRFTLRQWVIVTALGATGIFLYNLCFLYGIRLIEAGRGALVVALTPVVIAAADALLFGARMTPRKALGIALAMTGCLSIVTRGDLPALFTGEVGLGEWLILGCVVMWTTYTFIGRRATLGLTPLAATFGACLTGGAMLTVASLTEGSYTQVADAGASALAAIAFLGILGTALAFTWYADGVKQIGATRAGIYINLVPVFAVPQGALLLGERLGLPSLIGGLLVLAGVMLTTVEPTALRKELPA